MTPSSKKNVKEAMKLFKDKADEYADKETEKIEKIRKSYYEKKESDFYDSFNKMNKEEKYSYALKYLKKDEIKEYRKNPDGSKNKEGSKKILDYIWDNFEINKVDWDPSKINEHTQELYDAGYIYKDLDETNFEDSLEEDSLEEGQQGEGKGDDGLWNHEIEHLMRKYKKKGFKGVYPIDHLNKIPFKRSDKVVTFVMNTSPSNVKEGHWVAIRMDPDTLEYYDSFGEKPPKKFVKAMKQLMKKWSPENLIQFKINRVKFQRSNSDNCGYFAMKFLDDRYKGNTFKESTGFERLSKVIKGEKEIRTFKERVKEFNSL